MNFATGDRNTGRKAGWRAVPARVFAGVSAAAAAAGVTALLASAGCGLETPQAPRFDTTLYVPIREEIYTGQQMAAGLQAVSGDTTAPGPLTIRLCEPIDPVTLDGEISAAVRERTYAANLTDIDFAPPALPGVSLGSAELLPAGAPAPGEIGPVPPFDFGPRRIDLPSLDSFTEAAFTAGVLRLELTNNLPFPVGGELPGQVLRIGLFDRSVPAADPVVEWVLAEALAAGESARCERDLSGLVLSGALSIEIAGWSAGSEGAGVEIRESMGLDLALEFGDTRVERLVGHLPALLASGEGQIEFAERCAISEALISEGRLTCYLQSHLPAAATLVLEVPGLLVDGEPLRVVTHVGPGGVAAIDVDVAGATLARAGMDNWPLLLAAATEPTQETAAVALGAAATGTLRAADLRLAWVRGVMDHIAVDITPIETPIDFPAGTEGVEFDAAQVELVIRNHAAVAAEARLELRAQAGGDTVRVPLAAMLPAGGSGSPAETRVELDETDSAIAALLRLRPATVVLEGSIAIGDGVTEGAVQMGDYLDGQLTVLAPMRLVLETAHQQGDPFTVELDHDLREQVTENLLVMSIDAQIENHFPTGVAVAFHFARREGDLFVADDLILEAEPVACAQLDPVTRRVDAPAYSTVTLSVTAGDIGLFTEGRLHGGLAISLLGDGERPIEIWSTDYVKVKGVAAFRCRVE